MIPIFINISSPVDNYGLDSGQTAELAALVTVGLANSYANNMISIAKKELHSTRKMFTDGIRVVQLSKFSCAVDLIGVMPNAITFGMSAFDMKLGFSKSTKKVTKKGGGWYLTIPMRYANPNAVASSQVFSGVMPPEIYKLARQLQSGVQGRNYLKKEDLPAPYDENMFRPAVGDGLAGITNESKSPQFAGLTKSGSGNNTQYSTFRRVSDKTDPSAWLHKGLAAKNIHLRAFDLMNIGDESKIIIDSYLGNLGK